MDLLFLVKYYFKSAQGNLNNRPSHQETADPNWSWVSFSKLSFFAMIPANEKLMQNLEGSGAGLGSIMSWGMKNSNNDNIIIMMMIIIIIIIIIVIIINYVQNANIHDYIKNIQFARPQ